MGTTLLVPGQPDPKMDPKFRSGSFPALVTFGFKQIDPPAALYIQRDDVLVFQAVTQSPSETVFISIRMLQPAAQVPSQPDTSPSDTTNLAGAVGPGYVQVVQRSLVLANPNVLTTLQIQLQEGYLLSISVVGGNSTQRGNTFVRVFINRGVFQAISPLVAAMLIADYVTQFAPVGWPGGRVVSGTEGPGFLVNYSPGNPVAGADIAFAGTGVGRARLSSFAATFTASAGAANRIPTFQLLTFSAGNQFYTVQDTVAVTASQVVRYSLTSGGTNVRGAGLGTAANPIVVTLPIPSPALYVSGARVLTATQNIQVGDQWSAIQVITEEWFDLL